jgi:hypothetical protein
MTEFTETAMRHYCRNPKCRSKLKTPVSNSREAFCTKGCHGSYYLHRCNVCEKQLEDKYRKLKRGDGVKFIKARNSSPVCESAVCKRRFLVGIAR